MIFFSKLFSQSQKIKQLEKQASDILELPNDLQAIRVNGEVVITNKDKIATRFKDTFPANPARTVYQLMQKLNITANSLDYHSIKSSKEKEIWTCGFRDNEDRWVWYKNSEPQMTVSFKEAYPDSNVEKVSTFEDKLSFCSAQYGTKIIESIKKEGLKKTAEKVHALILENPFITITCNSCNTKENYTIDDLVDENKNAKYDSNFIVCGNCNNLVKLING